MSVKNFVPISFQASLAAGGVSLMPFVSLQLTRPHAQKLTHLSDFDQISSLDPAIFLITTMAIFVVIHICISILQYSQLFYWVMSGNGQRWFANNDKSHYTLFSPVASLAMSLNVLFGPIQFFAPQHQIVSSVLWIAVGVWFALVISAFALELKLARCHLVNPTSIDALDFGWLIDAFAFGMIALAGSGILNAMDKSISASWIEIGTWLILSGSVILLLGKTILLASSLLSREMPPKQNTLLSVLIVIPIICLIAISFFRLMIRAESLGSTGGIAIGRTVVIFSFSIALLYFFTSVSYIKGGINSYLSTPNFLPSQWGVVCAFVGIHVLGVFVSTFRSGIWPFWIHAIMILIACSAYILAFIRWMQSDNNNQTRRLS